MLDSSGHNKQVTFFGFDSEIDLLNSRGDIITFNNLGRDKKKFIIFNNGSVVEIPVLGTTFYRDSSFYIAIGRSLFKIEIPNILPVKLISFTATTNGENNNLHWSTAEEKNSKYFEIERSKDGINFYPIGKVSTKGTASINNYSYTDDSPLFPVNYYRLKIVDLDGKFEYSSIKVLKNSNFSIGLVSNPVTTSLAFKIFSDKEEVLKSSIISSDGKKLQELSFKVYRGKQTKEVPLYNLPKGNYFLEIRRNNNKTDLLKFLKL